MLQPQAKVCQRSPRVPKGHQGSTVATGARMRLEGLPRWIADCQPRGCEWEVSAALSHQFVGLLHGPRKQIEMGLMTIGEQVGLRETGDGTVPSSSPTVCEEAAQKTGAGRY